MRRDPRDARNALLSGLAGFTLLQLALAGLMAWKMPWLQSPIYASKADRLFKTIHSVERPQTVVMCGSSRTIYALRGSAAEPLLSRLGRPVVLFNFGQNGGGPVVHLLTLRRLLDDGVRPDLLLVEVLPPLLNRHGPFNDTSEAALPTASLRRDELALLDRYAGGHRTVRRSDWWLGWLVPSYQHRFALLSHTVPTLLRMSERVDYFRPIDSSGWLGISPAHSTPEKRAYALRLARDTYEPLLRGFAIGGPNVAALEELLLLCRARTIPVALVLMPEGPAFRSWYPPSVMREVRGLLDDLARRHHVRVVDAREWLSEDDFLDSHHVLPCGADTFSRRLAQEAIVPLLQGTAPTLARSAD